MPKFKDKTGEDWSIELDVGMLDKLQTDAGFDIDALQRDASAVGRLIAESPRTLGRILWVLCEEQATTRKIDPRAFGSRLDREALDKATDAFLEAVLLFCPRSSAGRAIKGRIPELLAKMDREIEENTRKMMEKELSHIVIDSPESSESIPPG